MYPARDQRFPIVQRTDGFLLSIAWLATGCTWLNAVDIPGAETMDRDVSMRDASPDAKIRDGATDAADANPWNWPDWHFDAGPLTNHPDDSSGPDAPDPTCTTHPELCGCGDGFEDDDAGVCVDIDECERGLASCGPLASCLNTDGSSRCRCDSYYDDVNGDGSSCVDGHLRSAHAFGGLGINLGYAVAYDDDANLFLTGSYDQSIAFQSEAHTAQGSFDMYLTKFDPSMQALWSRSFGENGDDRGFRMTTTSDGDPLVVGPFFETIDFGDGPLLAPGVASFVAKFTSAEGDIVWSRALPQASFYEDLEGWPSGIAADANGNVYAAGRFSGTFDFGTPDGSVSASGPQDLFVVKYAADGTPLWVYTLQTSGTSIGTALAVDSQSNIVVTGLVEGAAVFDQGPPNGYGAGDSFLMKLSASGTPIWSVRFGGSFYDSGTALAIGPRDEIFAVGGFNAALIWGDTTYPGGSGRNVYYARVASDGTLLWMRVGKSIGTVDAFSVAALGEDLIAAGRLSHEVSFGDKAIYSAGLIDGYVVRYAADGTLRWVHRYGGRGYDESKGIALDPYGNLAVTGWIEGPVEFGGEVLETVGWLGAWILRLRP